MTTEPMVHELKCWPPYFEDVLTGRKTFEARSIADRRFEIGDTLLLREYDGSLRQREPKTDGYTGRTCERVVTYVMGDGDYGIQPGHVVMALALSEQEHPAPSLGRDARERLEAIADQIDYALQARNPLDAEAQDDALFLRDLAKNPGDGGQEEAAGVEHFTSIHPHEATGGAVAKCTCGWGGSLCGNRFEAERSAAAHRVESTQPVPSCLSEEGADDEKTVRIELDPECIEAENVREFYPEAVGAATGALRTMLSPEDDACAHRDADILASCAVSEALKAFVAVSTLSAPSDTGGAGAAIVLTQEECAALCYAAAERPREQDGAALDSAVSKLLGPATSPQQSVPDTGEAVSRESLREKLLGETGLGAGTEALLAGLPDLDKSMESTWVTASVAFEEAVIAAFNTLDQPDPPGEVPGGDEWEPAEWADLQEGDEIRLMAFAMREGWQRETRTVIGRDGATVKIHCPGGYSNIGEAFDYDYDPATDDRLDRRKLERLANPSSTTRGGDQ